MDFLSEHQPEMLPGKRQLPPVHGVIEAPHGTTIVAVTFPGVWSSPVTGGPPWAT